MVKNLQVHQDRQYAPTLFITKGRQRVKQYNDNIIYLKNGDEFELEVFNPTSYKVLAKINLNGKYLGNGLVVRPGERVFLERYLDEAKKFLFETYQVDGSDPNVQDAVKNNGNVSVEFYAEHLPSFNLQGTVWVYHTYEHRYIPVYPSYYYTDGTISNNIYYSGTTTTLGSNAQTTAYTSTCNAVNSGWDNSKSIGCASGQSMSSDFLSYTPVETGRIEKGSDSSQTFSQDNTNFNSWYTWKTEWKILPESERPFVKEDLAVFCTNCGAKRKKSSHNFCPNCGQKF